MKSRCCNPKGKHYASYGGRGIKVCQDWLNSFESFLRDMGNCPSGKTLDRIDVNGDYRPGNCRWATPAEQALNRRNTLYIAIDGKRMTAKAAAVKFGVPYNTLRNMKHRDRIVDYLLDRIQPDAAPRR